MKAARKITLEVPDELLRRAQESTGKGITATIRHGLELVAAKRANAHLREMRGKVRLSLDMDRSREDHS